MPAQFYLSTPELAKGGGCQGLKTAGQEDPHTDKEVSMDTP